MLTEYKIVRNLYRRQCGGFFMLRIAVPVINYLSDSTNEHSYVKLRAVHVEGVT